MALSTLHWAIDMSYYKVLGVKETATDTQIRDAYRSAVRRVHPDTATTLSDTASSEMAAISEAWSVLSNSELRKLYDISRKTMGATAHSSIPAQPQPHYERAQFPWRMVLAFIVVGVVVVLVLNALSGPAVVSGPDGLLQSGSCIVVDESGAASEVDCSTEHYGVVSQLVGFDMTCPSDQESYRDRQGMGTACVVPK